MADLTNNTDNNSGGFANSPWAMALPIVLGAASILSPRIGQGISAGLQGLHWLDQRKKEQQRLSSIQNVSKTITDSTAQGQFPGMDKMIAAAGGGAADAMPLISRIAELQRPQLVHLPGGGVAQARQTPQGEMTLSDLRQGQLTEQDIAKQQLAAGGKTNPGAGEILAQIEANKLSFQKQQQTLHTEGALTQARGMLPIDESRAGMQLQKQVEAARQIAPIQGGAQVGTAAAMLPIQKQHAKDLQTVKDEAEMKVSPAMLPSIEKAVESLQGVMIAGTEEEKASAAQQIEVYGKLRSAVMDRLAGKLGVATPGKFQEPTAADLNQYNTIMKSGNKALISRAQEKAKKAWGKLP
jgi:hypothetical protein